MLFILLFNNGFILKEDRISKNKSSIKRKWNEYNYIKLWYYIIRRLSIFFVVFVLILYFYRSNLV